MFLPKGGVEAMGMFDGKKMDFILQELFREVNTLSVKIEKPDLKELALTMKLKVEELREQAQNLE